MSTSLPPVRAFPSTRRGRLAFAASSNRRRGRQAADSAVGRGGTSTDHCRVSDEQRFSLESDLTFLLLAELRRAAEGSAEDVRCGYTQTANRVTQH